MRCTNCGTEYYSGASFCSNCGMRLPIPGEPSRATPAKQPIYKKWWFWVLCFVVLSGVFSALSQEGPVTRLNASSPDHKYISTVPPSPEPTVAPNQGIDLYGETIGQQNALRAALDYLSVMPFSYKGLIKQLEFEKYSYDDAKYAADNCGADWNEQAVKTAQEYLELMAFSREGLIKQLEYEGFTHEQAVHGAAANGY